MRIWNSSLCQTCSHVGYIWCWCSSCSHRGCGCCPRHAVVYPRLADFSALLVSMSRHLCSHTLAGGYVEREKGIDLTFFNFSWKLEKFNFFSSIAKNAFVYRCPNEFGGCPNPMDYNHICDDLYGYQVFSNIHVASYEYSCG